MPRPHHPASAPDAAPKRAPTQAVVTCNRCTRRQRTGRTAAAPKVVALLGARLPSCPHHGLPQDQSSLHARHLWPWHAHSIGTQPHRTPPGTHTRRQARRGHPRLGRGINGRAPSGRRCPLSRPAHGRHAGGPASANRGEHVLSPAVAPASAASYACVRLCMLPRHLDAFVQ